MFGELKDVPDPQEPENGSQMNRVNEEMNVSKKDRCGCPGNPALITGEPAKSSQVETEARVCQVLRILRDVLTIYIYEISQNVKCSNIFLKNYDCVKQAK